MTIFQKVIFLIIFLLILLLLNFSSFGEVINLKALDLFRTNHPPHPDIVILAIDNKSIDNLGRWPWNRSLHARIINKLNEIGPLALGIDITFSEPQNTEEDSQLSAALKKVNYPVVLSSEQVFFKDQPQPKILSPLSIFLENSFVTAGIINVATDADGINRLAPEISSFSFQLAKALNTNLPKEQFLINFAGGPATFTTFSISDLVTDQIPKDKLSGKIILIGATASDLHDLTLIPPGQIISGVEWNANILDNLLLQRGIIVIPRVVSVLLGILIGFFYLKFSTKFSPKPLSIILVGLLFLFPIISFLFWQEKLALFFLTNSILAAALLIFNGTYRWIATEIEKRKIKQTFQPYFSPVVMDTILKDPSLLHLGGQSMEVTILFSDIRNFTTITEQLSPETLTNLLQEYFTQMSEEILKTDGVIDKFIGDALMAFWGAPIPQENHADRAVLAAVKMVKKIKRLQTRWQSRGLPFIDMGVGINSGVVTVGNMGSNLRFDYTLIGDNVNLASRLEGLNKQYKSHIIISQATKDKLKLPVKHKNLGQVLVKGKTKPVKIYQVIPFSGSL